MNGRKFTAQRGVYVDLALHISETLNDRGNNEQFALAL